MAGSSCMRICDSIGCLRNEGMPRRACEVVRAQPRWMERCQWAALPHTHVESTWQCCSVDQRDLDKIR